MVEQIKMLEKGENVLSMGDALKTTAIGLIVVFAVLFLLILSIELLHVILKDKKAQEIKKEVEPIKEERISAGVMAEAPEIENAAEDGEFIAAVSSAISVYIGKPNSSFVIKSIKKG